MTGGFNESILRPIVYYEYLKGSPPREAVRNICSTFKSDLIQVGAVVIWYKRFEEGETTFSQKRKPFDRGFDYDGLYRLLQEKPNANVSELARKLGVCRKTVMNHMPKERKVKRVRKPRAIVYGRPSREPVKKEVDNEGDEDRDRSESSSIEREGTVESSSTS